MPRLLAEVGDQRVQHAHLPFPRLEGEELVGPAITDEAHQGALIGLVIGVVVRLVHRQVRTARGSRQTGVRQNGVEYVACTLITWPNDWCWRHC